MNRRGIAVWILSLYVVVLAGCGAKEDGQSLRAFSDGSYARVVYGRTHWTSGVAPHYHVQVELADGSIDVRSLEGDAPTLRVVYTDERPRLEKKYSVWNNPKLTLYLPEDGVVYVNPSEEN